MVTWLFRLLLSIFDDDIGSDVGTEHDDATAREPGASAIPGQRTGSEFPERLPDGARDGQRSVT